ncbi:MAG: hypothetical protein ACFFA8_04585 [Promethearchaeota archaeon]
MELFKWLEEVERIYKELIDNAKKDKATQIEQLIKKEESQLKELIQKKDQYIKIVLDELSKDIEDHISTLKKKNKIELENIRNSYLNKKSKIIEIILDKMVYNF